MATPAERMRAHRERTRRGLRRLTIDVSEDDLRTLPNGDTKGLQAWTPISRRKQSASSLNDSLLEHASRTPPYQRCVSWSNLFQVPSTVPRTGGLCRR